MKKIIKSIISTLIVLLLGLWVIFPSLLEGVKIYYFWWLLFLIYLNFHIYNFKINTALYIALLITTAGAVLNLIFADSLAERVLQLGVVFWIGGIIRLFVISPKADD